MLFYYLMIRIVTQTMQHLGIAYILFFAEPMKVLALVLGSKVNHQYSVPTIYQRVSRTSIFE